MSLFYEMTLPIDSRDVDGNGFCKASALLGHIQEAATQAAEHGGFGRDMTLNGYHAFWMLTRVWYQLSRPLRWGDPLTIRTWHRGNTAATMYRDYDLFIGDTPVGECVSAWVLADLDSRQIIRLGTVQELQGTDGGALCKTKRLSKLRLPDHQAQRAADVPRRLDKTLFLGEAVVNRLVAGRPDERHAFHGIGQQDGQPRLLRGLRVPGGIARVALAAQRTEREGGGVSVLGNAAHRRAVRQRLIQPAVNQQVIQLQAGKARRGVLAAGREQAVPIAIV